ncbi:MAG: FMN-binding protein [Syntrophomonadaceae bacterium]|nr:FMN-binding protein [Syntrophomonadaceae bacterium]
MNRMKGKGMSRKVATVLTFVIALSVFASGCGGSLYKPDVSAYKDGIYTGKSSEDDKGAYGEVTITIAGGKVTDCSFVTWKQDGIIKDENYGKVNGEITNREYYEKAQLSVDAMEQYARRFAESGYLSEVDAVSGATISYDQFLEAAQDALEQ